MAITDVVANAKRIVAEAVETSAKVLAGTTEAAAPDTSSIYVLLTADHRAIKALLKALCETGPRSARKRTALFARLRALVTAHARAEEKYLYEPLLAHAETRAAVLEGTEEHHLTDVIMRAMARLAVSNERWTAKLTVLRECLEHHIDEEEDEIFAAARKVLPQLDADELGRQFAAAEAARLAHDGSVTTAEDAA